MEIGYKCLLNFMSIKHGNMLVMSPAKLYFFSTGFDYITVIINLVIDAKSQISKCFIDSNEFFYICER